LITDARGPASGTLDHRAIDWAGVSCASYALHQRITYQYPGPIRDLRQQLVVIPRAVHGDQRLRAYRLEVDGPAAHRVEQLDPFGNHIVSLHLPRVERQVGFTITLEIERHAAARPPLEPASAAAQFLQPTRLTEASAALCAAGKEIGVSRFGSPEANAALITRWVYKAMRYTPDVTTVKTTAAEAFALRAGVCQDYAQIMLVLCRLHGIPARYVSGHLLGEGGTHAWVEVLIPTAAGAGMYTARAFDPTHGCAADLRYVTVAVGRDYADVPPMCGSFQAPYGGVLHASKRASLTDVRYAAADPDATARATRSMLDCA